jgi:hypothetical protein
MDDEAELIPLEPRPFLLHLLMSCDQPNCSRIFYRIVMVESGADFVGLPRSSCVLEKDGKSVFG